MQIYGNLQRFPVVHEVWVGNTTGWWFQIFLYVHPYLGKISILTTPPKSDIAPEKIVSQRNGLSSNHFQVRSVSFREGNIFQMV